MATPDKNKLCQQYLTIIYQGMKWEHKKHFDQISATYGELLPQSVSKLINEIAPDATDSLIDLGSGLGKVCLQVFLQSTMRVVYGIEFIPELHQQAVLVRDQVAQDLPDFFQQRELNFICGDFLQLPLPEVNIALLASPCFNHKMLQQLATIFDNMPTLRYVLTLKPMNMLKRLHFQKTIRLEASWDSALCYVYRNPLR